MSVTSSHQATKSEEATQLDDQAGFEA
jgi:hypothetical protein